MRCRQGRNKDPKKSYDRHRAAVLRQGAGSHKPKGKHGVLTTSGKSGDMTATKERLETGKKQVRSQILDGQMAEIRQSCGQE